MYPIGVSSVICGVMSSVMGLIRLLGVIGVRRLIECIDCKPRRGTPLVDSVVDTTYSVLDRYTV